MDEVKNWHDQKHPAGRFHIAKVMRVLINAVSAYLVWCALVLGAAYDMTGIAVVIAVGAIALQILLDQDRQSGLRRVVLLTVLGTGFDTALIHLGLYTPAGFAGVVCPVWVSLLWANFATTYGTSLQWLRGRPVLAAVIGAVAGPMSYALAERWGAANVHDPRLLRYVILGGAWSVAMLGIFRKRASTASALVAGMTVNVLLLAGAPAAAGTHEVGGVFFAETVEAHGIRLQLHGAGLLRYRVIFKGYAAALYLPQGTRPSDVLEDVPKRLEVHYFWSIPAQAFQEAADALLSKNVSPERLSALRPRIEQLHRAYESVRPGDRYALTYVPHVGTELTLNGVLKARIPGADFASAYFSIWLGEHPIDRQLKQALLSFASP